MGNDRFRLGYRQDTATFKNNTGHLVKFVAGSRDPTQVPPGKTMNVKPDRKVPFVHIMPSSLERPDGFSGGAMMCSRLGRDGI